MVSEFIVPSRRAIACLSLVAAMLVSACNSDAESSIFEDNAQPEIVTEPDDPALRFDPVLNSSCESDVQKQWIYNNMLDYYLFYDQVPVVDPQSYSNTQALLAAVRFNERDSFSFLSDAIASTLQSEEGREFGLGFVWDYDENAHARLARVVKDSPFGRAGIERGDILVSVNGVAWDEVSDNYFDTSLLGTPDSVPASQWTIKDNATGDLFEVDIKPAEYVINTVLHSDLLTHEDYEGTIGYLVFSRFLATSADELQAIFQEFSDERITDLVLDLRYNRGGYVLVAEYLSSLIAGDARGDQLLYEFRHNDKYTDNDYSLNLSKGIAELGLSRVTVLTTALTASSAEIVISGLQPHMDVVTIGTPTSGKPYSQRGRVRCGLQLNAVEAEGFNSVGSSVQGGIPASCYAADDLSRNFGQDRGTGESEGMLAAALDYVVDGTCLARPPEARSNAAASEEADFFTKQGIPEHGLTLW